MSLAFTRIEIGDLERGRLLGRALATLRTPPGEDWLGRITVRRGAGWEILLSGPRRHFVGFWQTTVVSAERELFRCAIPPELQNVESVRRIVRGLLWDRASVVMDDETPLSRQLEDVAWDMVMRAGLPELEVRLARWPSVWGEPRYVGTVERHDRGEAEVLWCGVVRSASELGRALAAALLPAADILLETPVPVVRTVPVVADTLDSDAFGRPLPLRGEQAVLALEP